VLILPATVLLAKNNSVMFLISFLNPCEYWPPKDSVGTATFSHIINKAGFPLYFYRKCIHLSYIRK
jgi:hypothetical protein